MISLITGLALFMSGQIPVVLIVLLIHRFVPCKPDKFDPPISGIPERHFRSMIILNCLMPFGVYLGVVIADWFGYA